MVEIGLKKKYLAGGKSSQKSTSSITGTSRHRGESDKKLLEEARRQTKKHQMTLVLKEGRKRTWVRTSSIPR